LGITRKLSTPIMRSLAHAIAAAAITALVLATVPAHARRHDPEKLPVTRIRDLHY
jgi:hypothetical protein